MSDCGYIHHVKDDTKGTNNRLSFLIFFRLLITMDARMQNPTVMAVTTEEKHFGCQSLFNWCPSRVPCGVHFGKAHQSVYHAMMHSCAVMFTILVVFWIFAYIIVCQGLFNVRSRTLSQLLIVGTAL